MECRCRCCSHRDFGVPWLSFGKLIQPPAPLCVCVTGWVTRFARSSNPLLGRSRPRFRSHKGAGATAPAPRPRSRVRPLAAARPAGRVKSPPMFVVWWVLVFPARRFGACRSYTAGPSRKELPGGDSSLRSGLRPCAPNAAPNRPPSIFFPTVPCCIKSDSSTAA